MTKTIVNLAHPIVVTITEEILETYPSHPYRQAFANPDLRQKLIAYVLSRIPGDYVVMDEACDLAVNSDSLCCSPDQRCHIEGLVHQGLEKIIQEDWNWTQRHIPEETSSGFAPSSWFG